MELQSTVTSLEEEVRQIERKLINSNESSSLIKLLQEYQLKAKDIESSKQGLAHLQAQLSQFAGLSAERQKLADQKAQLMQLYGQAKGILQT